MQGGVWGNNSWWEMGVTLNKSAYHFVCQILEGMKSSSILIPGMEKGNKMGEKKEHNWTTRNMYEDQKIIESHPLHFF